jgi:hypothetical protein
MEKAIDPNHVPEILVTGPTSAHFASNVLILTCTASPPDIGDVLGGNPNPKVTAVVVARLAIPLDNAAQIARILNTTLANLKTAAGTA